MPQFSRATFSAGQAAGGYSAALALLAARGLGSVQRFRPASLSTRTDWQNYAAARAK